MYSEQGQIKKLSSKPKQQVKKCFPMMWTLREECKILTSAVKFKFCRKFKWAIKNSNHEFWQGSYPISPRTHYSFFLDGLLTNQEITAGELNLMLQLLWTTTRIGDRQYLKRIITVYCDRKRRILHSTTYCDQEIIFLSDRATVLMDTYLSSKIIMLKNYLSFMKISAICDVCSMKFTAKCFDHVF